MNTPSIPFAQQVERAAGLDIHKVKIVATISGIGISTETRDFKSTTSSLTELKDWLLEKGITHVAMESTGIFIGSLSIIFLNLAASPSWWSMPVTSSMFPVIRPTRKTVSGFASFFVRAY